jgi:hypothetical protein
MTKLELIQSIVKHRQAGAAMCTCIWISDSENPPKAIDVTVIAKGSRCGGDQRSGARPASASLSDGR